MEVSEYRRGTCQSLITGVSSLTKIKSIQDAYKLKNKFVVNISCSVMRK